MDTSAATIARRPLGGFELVALSDGYFHLDGGSMFGIVPRPLWEKRAPPDARNRIKMGLNLLLIRTPESCALVETGIGGGFSLKESDIYSFDRRPGMDASLLAAGVDRNDVKVVINTHLHFDHAGGNTVQDSLGRMRPAFGRATYFVQEREWIAARSPGLRSRGSYRSYNFLPLEEAGVLERVDGEFEPLPGIRLVPTPGHTAGHQSVRIESGGETVFYLGDLVPTAAHLELPWVMSYDLFPQETVDRKREVLEACAEGRWLVMFPHDPVHSWGRVSRDGDRFRFEP